MVLFGFVWRREAAWPAAPPSPKSTHAGRSQRFSSFRRSTSDHALSNHSPPFRSVAVLREDPRGLRPQGAFMEKRAHSADHAEARSDAADRRLSSDTGDADRRGRFLRHTDHHPRNRTPISVAEFCFPQAQPGSPGRSVPGPTALSSRTLSILYLGPSVRRSRKNLSKIAVSCAAASLTSTRCERRSRRCGIRCGPTSAGSRGNSATGGNGSLESSALLTSAPT